MSNNWEPFDGELKFSSGCMWRGLKLTELFMFPHDGYRERIIGDYPARVRAFLMTIFLNRSLLIINSSRISDAGNQLYKIIYQHVKKYSQ